MLNVENIYFAHNSFYKNSIKILSDFFPAEGEEWLSFIDDCIWGRRKLSEVSAQRRKILDAAGNRLGNFFRKKTSKSVIYELFAMATNHEDECEEWKDIKNYILNWTLFHLSILCIMATP